MTMTPEEIKNLTRAVAGAIIDGYRIYPMPDGIYRIALPPKKAEKRGVAYYTVDLLDHRTPCTCMAGRHGRRCRHLSLAEAFRLITIISEAVPA